MNMNQQAWAILMCLIALMFLLLVCSLLSGCVAQEPGTRTKSDVGFSSIHVQMRPPEVTVAFWNDTDYTHIVQEIQSSHGWSVVECWRVSKGDSAVDVHWWTSYPQTRDMVVYAANVEGADERGNFAMLPENMGGSVSTTVGENFNAGYQQSHDVRGRITSRSKLEFHWKIVDDGEFVIVPRPAVIGGVE